MLNELKNEWKETLESHLKKILNSKEISPLTMTEPPKSELGDVAFPLFQYAKVARKAPQAIAEALKESVEASAHPEGEIILAGGYFNVKLSLSAMFSSLYESVMGNGDDYGKNDSLKGKKIMLEFSCPNTNKPLHLGHMRNDSLGESVANILKANGAEVMKVNLINNRGVHICKSMLAYREFGDGETPESTGEKGDHLVGRYYVRFATWAKEWDAMIAKAKESGDEDEVRRLEESHPDKRAQAMLKDWEDGKSDVIELWNLMNRWTLDGLFESYRNMGISFDRFYYESETYKYGKSEVLKGLEEGVFYREADGSVQIDLSEIGLDKKVLLRKDGTTIYITQDIGTAIRRHDDYPFDSLIYVVGSEQAYHFKVLFYILKKLGYAWADELYHLSYGMVNLPEGKMKSREGTVVDADDLLTELESLAKEEIISKNRESLVEDVDQTAHSIALAALNYYLLQVSPGRDMIFDPKKSISFNGNTGPYLEYMGARISSILRKAEEENLECDAIDGSLLNKEDELTLIKLISDYPSVVAKAAEGFDPSVIAAYLYSVAKTFSHYYHDNQIVKAETRELSKTRLALAKMVLTVLRNGFSLIGIPFLKSM